MGLFNKEDDHTTEFEVEGKKRPNVFGRARSALINAVDQNADGSFDMNDVTVLADNMSAAAKKQRLWQSKMQNRAENSLEAGWIKQRGIWN